MLAGLDGDLHLRADAVVGGHEDRIAETRGLQVEEAAEAADLRIRSRPPGGAHQRLDRFHHGVAGVDIDTRLRVGEPFPVGRHASAIPNDFGTALTGHGARRESLLTPACEET